MLLREQTWCSRWVLSSHCITCWWERGSLVLWKYELGFFTNTVPQIWKFSVNIHHFFPLQIWEIKWPQERVLSAFAQGSLLMNLFYSSPSLSTVSATHSQTQSKNFKIEYSINEQFIPFKLHHLGSMIKSRVMKSRVIPPGLAWIIPLSGESGPLVI